MKEFLDEQAAIICRPEFIAEDPVQFPRRFESLQDIEIVSLLAAHIAWGKRSMICRDAERLLSLMGHDPYCYVMEEGYLDLDDGMNIHRTFFARDLKHLLVGLREIYRVYGSIDNFSAHVGAASDYAPAWKPRGGDAEGHHRCQRGSGLEARPSKQSEDYCLEACQYGSPMACARRRYRGYGRVEIDTEG